MYAPYYDHFRFCSAGREWWSTKSVYYDGERGTGDSLSLIHISQEKGYVYLTGT